MPSSDSRRPSAAPWKQREAKPLEYVQRLPPYTKRRNHRYLGFVQLKRERVLFKYLLVGPALRSVEFRDQKRRIAVFILDTQLINAIFVTVESEHPAVTVESSRVHRIPYTIRRQG